MTDRVSKIIIRGDVKGLQAALVAGGKSLNDFGDRITNQDKKSQQFRKGLTTVGDAAGKMGLVAAAGLGVMVVASAKFDSSMSKVQAATHESAGSMELLRAAAIKAGADTAFSATEAADAITAMSKAGVSTKDILAGGLNGALSLAAAGELDVATSAEIAATAMTQFGLSGKDIPHIADLLAAGAGKAQGEVTDMATALKYVGPVAHQMGISIEETTGTIAELASQGILADQAGTSLRGMLSSLTSPSKIAKKAMEDLGISLYDAQGKFIGFNGVADQLHSTMGGLSEEQRNVALGQIFGNEQITAARILYAGGAADVDKWTKAVNDQGFAAETASIKMDNLAGDFEKLKGSLETLLITGGDGSQGFLRGVVQGADAATNALNSLPAPAKGAVVGLTAIAAVTGGALWLGATVINKVAATRVAIEALEASGSRAAGAMGAMGKAASGAAIILAGLAAQDLIQGGGLDKSLPGLNELTNTLTKLGATKGNAELPKNFDDLADAIARVGDPNRAQALQDSLAGIVGFGGGDDVKNYRAEITALDGALANIASTSGAPAAKAALAAMADAQDLTAGQTQDLLRLLPGYRDALAGTAGAADDTAGATAGLTGATDASTGSLDKNTQSLKDNIKQMQERYTNASSALDKEIAFQEALDAGAERQKERKDIEKQIRDAEKAGAKERADLQRNASESGADTSKDMSDLQHKLASARADLGRAKTASAKSSAQDSIASIQSQIGDKQTGQGRAARDAQEQIQESLDRQAKTVADLKARLADYTLGVDLHTKAGRDNVKVIKGVADRFNEMTDAQKNAKGKYHEAREALIEQAKAFKATDKQAKHFADTLLQIPPRVQAKIDLQKAKAQAALDAFSAAFKGLDGKVAKAFIKVQQDHILGPGGKLDRAGGGGRGGSDSGFADGGFTGAGAKFEPAGIVHKGEFVIDAENTRRHWSLLNAIQSGANNYRQQSAQMRGYANGGYVSGGGGGIDVDKLVAAVVGMRPVVGTQYVQPHDYNEFRRQQDANERLAAMGAVTFR